MRISTAFTAGVDAIDLIELGAGDGTKTAVLIDHFLMKGVDFTFRRRYLAGSERRTFRTL